MVTVWGTLEPAGAIEGWLTSTDLEWPDTQAVLGVREDWAAAYPNTHIALVKAPRGLPVLCG